MKGGGGERVRGVRAHEEGKWDKLIPGWISRYKSDYRGKFKGRQWELNRYSLQEAEVGAHTRYRTFWLCTRICSRYRPQHSMFLLYLIAFVPNEWYKGSVEEEGGSPGGGRGPREGNGLHDNTRTVLTI